MPDNATRVSLDGNREAAFGFNTTVKAPSADTLDDGFNEYGVRENEDGSIDVRFNAMEPGERKGYDITKTFLRNAANKDYDRIPVQLDHSKSQRANVGYIEPDNIAFTDPFLGLQPHIPNTGASVREDVIADFTHEPPAINDISVSVDPKTVEVEAPAHENAAPKFVDGRIDEVSLTPFPAGYDNGGLTPEFSEAVEEAVDEINFDDDCGSGGESQLITKQFTIK